MTANCPPTWDLAENLCFKYFGGPLPYDRAKAQCESEESLLADVRGRYWLLTDMMRRSQNDYDTINMYTYTTRAWVYSSRLLVEDCPVVRNYLLETYNCYAPLPYFCSKDPDPKPPNLDLLFWILALCFLFVILLALAGLVFAALRKAKVRKIEHLLRGRDRSTVQSQAHARSQAGTAAPSVAGTQRFASATTLNTQLLGAKSIAQESGISAGPGSSLHGAAMQDTLVYVKPQGSRDRLLGSTSVLGSRQIASQSSVAAAMQAELMRDPEEAEKMMVAPTFKHALSLSSFL